MSLPIAADLNASALTAFAVLVAITLGITYWASKRTRTATDFWAAGRGISSAQNGFAISGDLMSAATFLGFTGLIFLAGFDGWVLATAAITPFLLMLFLFGERMRNTGKFTVADVLSFRLRERPARAAAAVATLSIAAIYLIAQLVGAGVVLQALAGTSFGLSVVITGAVMLVYVIFGGMLATTWVQIVKAVLLMSAGITLTLWVLGKASVNPIELFNRAADEHPAGTASLGPGLTELSPMATISAALAFIIGTAALPHILIRFFTVPDAEAARRSLGWAIGLIGSFFVMTSFIGYGARMLLGTAGEEAAGPGGNLAAPLLAEELGGGAGTTGGDLFLAFVSAVAFATILAVVAGLVISASGAVAHDLWTNILRRGADTEREEPTVARLAAGGIGVTAIVLAVLAGSGFNVAFLVGLALSVAAASNFPALLLALTWPRFTTTGAVVGIGVGLISSLVLIILSPPVWPGPDSEGSPFPLQYPTVVALPLGFIGCWLGTVLRPGHTGERSFSELLFRSETGLGAEGGQAVEVGR
jgi:cation/acetate symporter